MLITSSSGLIYIFFCKGKNTNYEFKLVQLTQWAFYVVETLVNSYFKDLFLNKYESFDFLHNKASNSRAY